MMMKMTYDSKDKYEYYSMDFVLAYIASCNILWDIKLVL